jgi:hypothetical protein
VLKTDGAQMDEMQRALAEGVLSDWHLVFFLAQCGMFEEVRPFAAEGCPMLTGVRRQS